MSKKCQGWKNCKTTTELRCKRQFLPLITHAKVGHRRKNNIRKKKKHEKILL